MRIYQRNKISCFLLAFILIQALLMLINVAWGGGRIDNIRLEREGDYTRVTIYGDKPFEFSHSIEEAKNGKPHRLIIDCQDMVFDLPKHEFREGLPPGIINAIRTSQYQVTPEKIVRVVLDLNGTVVYKVLERGSENQATIAILTTKEPDFTQWMAVKETKEDNRVGLAKQTVETKTGTETAKVKMPAEREDMPALATTAGTTARSVETQPENQPPVLPPLQSLSELVVAEKLSDENPQYRKAYLKPISYADTGDVLLSQNQEYTWGYPITTQVKTPSPEKGENETKHEVAATTPTATLPESEIPIDVSLKQVPAQTASSPKVEVKNTETHQAVEDVLLSQKSAVNSTARTQTSESQPTVFSSNQVKDDDKASTPGPINHSSVQLGPYLEEKTSPDETKKTAETELVKTATGTGTGTEMGKEQTVATDLGSTLKRGIGAVLGAEGLSAHESDTLAPGVMTIQN
ncbi:MAG: AMIN domain-containing protein, partial [Candidatus Zixiibacteriota bacterium]